MRPAWLIVLFAVGACTLGEGLDLPDGEVDAAETSDADAGDVRTDTALDGGIEASPDVDAGAGPITLVALEADLVVDRVCDLDGDDIRDNAIADLGEPGATLLATAISSVLSITVSDGSRWILHMPWVDDLATPDDEDVTVLSFSAIDEEHCEVSERDDDDDFSGHEPFCAKIEHLDACGEPLSSSDEALLANGELTAGGWSVLFGTSIPLILRGALLEGTVAPLGASAEVTLCGYVSASELGDAVDADDPAGLSLLEHFLGGGQAYGWPTVPGLEVDFDADGDGLERFELDGELRIERCIDGDDSVIEGDGCWRDHRIADGFSLTFRARFVSAVYWRRQTNWDRRECGPLLAELENYSDVSLVHGAEREICPDHATTLDALLTCEEANCRDRCEYPPVECRACAEDRCAAELAACLEAPDCCPEPPPTSVWDPA